MRALRFVTVLSSVLCACTDERNPLSPIMNDAAAPQAAISNGGIVDVSGSWLWSAEELLTFPDWVATDVLLINAEGPHMMARCVTAGTLTLVQNGTALTGESTVVANDCVTKGGQSFVGAPLFVSEPVTDGSIRGRSVKLHVAGFPVACDWHAVVSEGANGVASALNGGGRCIVPGHPKSNVPGFTPPPAGTSHSLEWTAVRS